MGYIIKPNWYEMDRASSGLAYQLDKEYGSQLPFEYIVGVAQGGLFPAMILSGLYDIPLFSAGIRPMTEVDNNLTTLPKIQGAIVSGTGLLAPCPTLLVVNTETSYEMNKVVQHYINEHHKVITAAIYFRDGGTGLRPNLFWDTIGEHDVVYYPWETHND